MWQFHLRQNLMPFYSIFPKFAKNGTTHKSLQQSVNVYVEMLLMQILVQHISCRAAQLMFGFKICTI